MTWSRGQSVVAQSSGEAEFYAIIAGAHEGLAVQSTLAEIGINLKLRVWSDSSAARTMCHRLGAGSLKHVETKHFHIQEMLAKGRLTVEKVETDKNPGDLGTKAATVKMLEDKLHLTGLAEVRSTRPSTISSLKSITSGGCINAATLQALIGLLQCLSAKGDRPTGAVGPSPSHPSSQIEQYEQSSLNGDVIVPLMMISGLLTWAYIVYLLVVFFRSGCSTRRPITTTRNVGIQTDEVDVGIGRVPAVAVVPPAAPVTQLPNSVYFAPSRGQVYHTRRYCSGLGNANDVVGRRVCITCQGQER